MSTFGNAAFSVSLIYGTYKKNSVFLEPWLVLKAIVIGFSIFNVGIFLVFRILGYKLFDIFLQLINIGLESYMFIVVYSLYTKIKVN